MRTMSRIDRSYSRMWVPVLAAGMAWGGGALAQTKPATPAKPAPPPPAKAAPVAPAQKPGVVAPLQKTGTVTPVQRPGTPPVVKGTNPPTHVGPGPVGPAGGGKQPPLAPAPNRLDPKTLPPGNHATRDGGQIRVKEDGSRQQFARDGHLTAMHTPGGPGGRPPMDMHLGRNGRPDMVRVERPGGFQTVRREPGGVRYVESVHRGVGGETRVVMRGRDGYVERPIYGREGYMRRSYLRDGHQYAVVYRGYHYYGVPYYRPVPAYIYGPAYYGWAVRPWGPPVAIQVGFASQPWYGAYGTAFTPYGMYASPDQWMTDQILAQNMQQAYNAGLQAGAQGAGPQAGQDTGYATAPPPVITPELKQQFNAQVAQEVKEQSQQAAAGPDALAPPVAAGEADQMPDALKPGHVVFRVVASLTVDSEGQECTLNSDDWIIRDGGMDPTDKTVTVRVAASRATDCAQGATAKVALNDLMTMQNEEDQQIQSALKLASESMGKNGMPVGPAAAPVEVAGGKSQADMDVASTLQKEQTDAAVAEQQAMAAIPAAKQ